MSPVWQWVIGLALALVVLKLLVLWLQPRLAFYPVPGPTPPPPGFTAFTTIAADGTTIGGWYSPIAAEGPVFLYTCGNAGNLTDRIELLREFADAGGSIIAFNYRGTGNSMGSPSEDGVYQDAEAVYSYLIDTLSVNSSRVVLWGHSIGGAVACELARRRPCAGLVLEATFRSAKIMAKRILPLLPLGWLMTYRLDNEATVPTLNVPILFVHGTADHVIPQTDSEILHGLARHSAGLWLVEGADHNDVYLVASGDYYRRLLDFGRTAISGRGTP